MDSSFPHFKLYSEFLLKHHVDAVAAETLEKARQSELPVLKLLKMLSDEELLEVTKSSFVEQVFRPVIQEKPFSKIKERINSWKANSLIIPREELFIEDITSINNLRKQVLFDFLTHYSCPGEDLIQLVKEIDSYFSVWTDISLKAYEDIQKEEIESKNDLLSGIMSNFPVIITKLSKQGEVIYSAGAGLKILGLNDNELSGRSIFERFPDAVNTKRALQEGKPISFSSTVKSASGELHEFQSFYLPEKDGIIGFSIDTTEKREAEQQLARFIEEVKDYAIFMLNPDGTIASWNNGARTMKGYTREEIKGKHFSVFYPQKKRDEKFPDYELEQAKKHGRFEDEGIRIRKDGSTFYANVVITALFDSNNNILGFAKITRDLTERKKHEEELKRANLALEDKVRDRTAELIKTIKDLKKINNDLDSFIYTASHDLKAPISNLEGLISGLYEEMSRESRTNPGIQTFKEMINSSITQFQDTIQELTEIAKIQKDTDDEVENINLDDVLNDVKTNIREFILKNQANIVTDFNNCRNIPFVRKNLKSILYNLISNGIKYRSTERRPEIRLSCYAKGGNYIITCRDNGMGIKRENKEKIFSMFKRFHTHVDGTGVGLYIVKRIIENAGGVIEVESEEGRGTTFMIRIPKDHHRKPFKAKADVMSGHNSSGLYDI